MPSNPTGLGPRRTFAALVVLALALAPALGAVAATRAGAAALPAVLDASRSLADLVTAGAFLVTAGLCAWLTFAVLLAGADALGERRDPPGRRGHSRPPTPSTRRAPVPAAVRRLVSLAVGLALGSGVVAAQAAPRIPEPSWPVSAPLEVPAAPAGAAVPETPTTVGTPATTTTVDAARPGTQPGVVERLTTGDPEHVVLRGDTLWDIAAANLGPGASAGEVHGEVQRLHHLNRAVVGADPDLLLPGQVLRLR